ncbi:hypothetical protein A7K94_0220510 [Modestobacter sp. VKM Ac-2676]|nr:hypothetical protein A7K94_0220510 [Modestobacter sp. VKM Ac-2676]
MGAVGHHAAGGRVAGAPAASAHPLPPRARAGAVGPGRDAGDVHPPRLRPPVHPGDQRLRVLLAPVCTLPPRPVGWFDGPVDGVTGGAADFERQKRYAAFPAVYNVTGQPALSVPLWWTPEGLPIGTMLVGRPAEETTLLSLAAQLEESRPWAHRHPATW